MSEQGINIYAQHEAVHAVMSVYLRYPLRSVKIAKGAKSEGSTVSGMPNGYFGTYDNPRFDRLRKCALMTVAPEVWMLLTLFPETMADVFAQRYFKADPAIAGWCRGDIQELRTTHKLLCRDLCAYELTFPAFKRRLMKEAFEVLSADYMIEAVFEVSEQLVKADDKCLSGKRVRQIVQECKAKLPAKRSA